MSNKKQETELDLVFLRSRFEELNREIRLPASLEAEAMRKLLDEEEPIQFPQQNHIWQWKKSFLGIAACFVIVIGSIFAIKNINHSFSMLDTAAESVSDPSAGVPPKQALQKLQEQLEMGGRGGGGDDGLSEKSTGDSPESASVYASSVEQEDVLGAHFITNYTQLRDEIFAIQQNQASMEINNKSIADFAQPLQKNASAFVGMQDDVSELEQTKTDGIYLYQLISLENGASNISIVEADDMQITGKIQLEGSITDYYITGDRLITVGGAPDAIPSDKLPAVTITSATDETLVQKASESVSSQVNWTEYDTREKEIAALQANVYDISDRAAPKEIQSFTQDGSYRLSQLENGVVYLVSTYTIDPALNQPDALLSSLVPAVYDEAEERAQLLAADQIAVLSDIEQEEYLVVSVLNPVSGNTSTQAVLGGSDGLYLSKDSLYLYNVEYEAEEPSAPETTQMIRFSLAGDGLRLAASGQLQGYPSGRNALMESEGSLRAVLSKTAADGSLTNSFYVLDASLNCVSKLEGIAPGETVNEVRYFGSLAYLNAGAVYAVNLSGTQPKLMGKADSANLAAEYLQPVGNGVLIGVGRSHNTNGAVDGLKLSLLNIADPLHPQEIQSYHIAGKDAYSTILNYQDAALLDAPRNLFAFPVTLSSGESFKNSYYIFSYDKKSGLQLKIKSDLGEGAADNRMRAFLIDDAVYLCTPEKIDCLPLNSVQTIKNLRL